MTYKLVSIHGMDPRGAKVGGIETHVRQLLKNHPEDLPLLMIGIDDTGLLELGKMREKHGIQQKSQLDSSPPRHR